MRSAIHVVAKQEMKEGAAMSRLDWLERYIRASCEACLCG